MSEWSSWSFDSLKYASKLPCSFQRLSNGDVHTERHCKAVHHKNGLEQCTEASVRRVDGPQTTSGYSTEPCFRSWENWLISGIRARRYALEFGLQFLVSRSRIQTSSWRRLTSIIMLFPSRALREFVEGLFRCSIAGSFWGSTIFISVAPWGIGFLLGHM